MLKSLTPNAAGVGYRLLKKKVIIFWILFKGVQISFRRFKPEIGVGFSHQLLVIIDWSGNSPTEGNTFVGLSVGDILPCAWWNSPPFKLNQKKKQLYRDYFIKWCMYTKVLLSVHKDFSIIFRLCMIKTFWHWKWETE